MESKGLFPCLHKPLLVLGFNQINPIHIPSISLRSTLLLSSHQCLVLRSGPFKFSWALYAFIFASVHATCPTHFSGVDLTSRIMSDHCTNYEAPHHACSFPPTLLPTLACVQIFSSAPSLFSNTLCSSLYVRDQVSHPQKLHTKFRVVYIFIFMVLDSRWEDRRFWTEWL